MTYIENIFLCMVSPLLVAALCMGRRHLRFFLFCIVGMGVCLLSAYINTFLASVCQADALAATAEIAPVVEEMMKLLPLVFYLLAVSYTHLDVYKRQSYQCLLQGHAHISGGVGLQIDHRSITHG